MEDSIGLLLLLQVILIGLNAIFACAEIAVLSINETKLQRMAEQGDKKAGRLFRLTAEPAKFLATIQVAITLSGFLGSAFAADHFSGPLVDWILSRGINIPYATLDAIAVIVITLILSYFTLIFGELVPKRIAMKKPEQLALGISGLISGISTIFKPIVWFLSASTNLVLRLCGIDPSEADDQVSEEEIRMMVDAGSEKGAIDHQEKEFIQNVFEFNDIDVGDIATHRTDTAMLWMEDSDEVWAVTIHESRHTRYPVCDGSADNIIGILNAKDYFRLEDKSRQSLMANAVQPALLVLETVKADILFRNMRKSRSSMAIVMDEYGGMVGIITLNDLIEELVGELNDEPEDRENPSPHIAKTGDSSWELFGNIPLEDIEEATGIELPSRDHNTLTGLVFEALGSIPADGRQDIRLSVEGMEVHILSIEEHQIARAKISLPAESPEQ